jgi:predicted Zn-dependent protease
VASGVAALAALGACRLSDVAGNVAGNVVGGRAGELARAAGGSISELLTQVNVSFSPEQEYYLGRTVAANMIAQYGLDTDEPKQEYVRVIGSSIVALAARVNDTHAGYHFALLASKDVANGFSGPGGFVMITRAALERCRNEEEVAGILAHEIAHISLRHGEAVIRAGAKWKSGFSALGQGLAGLAGSESTVNQNFASLLAEVADDFSKQIATEGYGSKFELEADREGTLILYDAGYDGSAIQSYLQAAPGRAEGTWSTHPEAAVRIKALDAVVKEYGGTFDGGVGKAARDARFAKAMGRPVAEPAPK